MSTQARITLKTQALFNSAALNLCPHSSDVERVVQSFQNWTNGHSERPEIYSDYRAKVLERDGLPESLNLARRLRENFDKMFVLGIGGSALGAKCVLSALEWSVPPKEKRDLIIAENLDPIEFEEQWEQIDPARTCFVIISKSGGTLETMTQASAIFDRLERLGLPLHRHVIAVTDSKDGALRKWASANSVTTLSIPSGVGGRFSVLTPVGLLPIAFSGIDVESLFLGALEQFQYRYIDQNRLAQLGQRLAELERVGFVAHNFMPYSTKLKDVGAWFVQLWGESLGKKRKGQSAVGMIPMTSVGATDQHSLLQLLVEGPNRIVTGFVRIKNWPQRGHFRSAAAKLPSEFAGLSYAFGRSFGEILNAEQSATEAVLTELNRPNYTIEVQDCSPQSLGALLALYMDLVVFTAAALEINPFDQPGVELGKRKMPEILSQV